jgi:predicted Na+-dependent transporter
MKKVRAIRQFLEKRKSRSIDLALGIFVGILILPLLSWVLSCFAKLSNELLGVLLLLLCLTQLLMLAWLILLYDNVSMILSFTFILKTSITSTSSRSLRSG